MFINMPNNELFYVKHGYDEKPIELDFPIHTHSHYELLIFISGDITYLVEGNSYNPKPYDVLLFDIAETHKVLVHSNTPYERLVIQMDKRLFLDMSISNTVFSPFVNRTLGENNILHASSFKDDLWKKCVLRLMECNSNNKIDVISLLLPLLNEIYHAFSHEKNARTYTPLSLQIMMYINDHITDEISLEIIAKLFFISRTTLYSIFKQSTGTTLHNYVNVKRLIMAQDMLRQGEKPTTVYDKCGFKDYTSFFRAYKKLFNKSPKCDTIENCYK